MGYLSFEVTISGKKKNSVTLGTLFFSRGVLYIIVYVCSQTLILLICMLQVHPYFVNWDLISFCHSRDVVVTAYSPLGSPDRPNAESDDPILLHDPVVVKIAEKRNKTPAQVENWQVANSKLFFLVACYATYKSLCRLDGRLVCPHFDFSAFSSLVKA